MNRSSACSGGAQPVINGLQVLLRQGTGRLFQTQGLQNVFITGQGIIQLGAEQVALRVEHVHRGPGADLEAGRGGLERGLTRGQGLLQVKALKQALVSLEARACFRALT